jgi:transcription antitermination factor NusG
MTTALSPTWFAAYTLPKFEKRAYLELAKQNVEAYLPVQKVFKQWSDRVKRQEVPLFPNYIFIRNTESDTMRALRTRGILRFVSFDGKPAIIADHDIEAIRKLESENPEVERNLVEGASVRIIRGPLAGFVGKLFSKKGRVRFAVRVETIGQSLSLEVPAAYLEQI